MEKQSKLKLKQLIDFDKKYPKCKECQRVHSRDNSEICMECELHRPVEGGGNNLLPVDLRL